MLAAKPRVATLDYQAFAWQVFLLTCLLVVPLSIRAAETEKLPNTNYEYNFEPTPSVMLGGRVYVQRCEVCHGDMGLGDGVNPSTQLTRKIPDPERIRTYVIWGGLPGQVDPQSPPWGHELSWTEVESVVMFAGLLQADFRRAVGILARLENDSSPDMYLGRLVFRTRCALCHGETGKGDGRMAKITNPPPVDLRESRVPNEYLRLIVSNGGESVGRSFQMPPWRDELSPLELDSVLLYTKTLRE